MILVTGVSGQVGSSLVDILKDKVVALTRSDLDLSRPDDIRRVLEKHRPGSIINPAAYTMVDKAESESELAHAINGTAPRIMAEYCRDNRIPLVHFSTDYVFDGSGENYWREDDIPSPLSVYGASKLAGEQAILETANGTAMKYLIFRTSWVYDASGKNFLNTMLRLGREREELKVVADQYGAPSYAPFLASAASECLEKAEKMPVFPSGIYNLCCAGTTTWHGFAQEIFRLFREKGENLKVQNVLPIKSEEYPTPARRPLNSRLNLEKIMNTFNIYIPNWEECLIEALDKKAGG